MKGCNLDTASPSTPIIITADVPGLDIDYRLIEFKFPKNVEILCILCLEGRSLRIESWSEKNPNLTRLGLYGPEVRDVNDDKIKKIELKIPKWVIEIILVSLDVSNFLAISNRS